MWMLINAGNATTIQNVSKIAISFNRLDRIYKWNTVLQLAYYSE